MRYVVGYVLDDQLQYFARHSTKTYRVASPKVHVKLSKNSTELMALAVCVGMGAVEYDVERLPSGSSVTKATTETVCGSSLTS